MLIPLAGVVVNNGIVLLDDGEQLRDRGWSRRRTVIVTGMRRLRPMVLTAVTTILGLVPTVAGFGFDFRAFAFVHGGESSHWWRPMGIAVAGLAFATFLTLIFLPVLYDLLLEGRERSRTRQVADLPESGGTDLGAPSVDREGRELDRYGGRRRRRFEGAHVAADASETSTLGAFGSSLVERERR